MKGQKRSRAGWFRVEHNALGLIREYCDPKRRAYAITAYTTLLQLANDHRREPFFEMSAPYVAALAGISEDSLTRAVRELVRLGLVAKARGKWKGVSRWTVPAVAGWAIAHSG